VSFNSSDYLALADELVKHCGVFAPEEACLRSAMSRAYYAAFVVARDFAASIDGLSVACKGGDHVLVRDHFRQHSNHERQQVGRWLSRLLRHRTKADYDPALGFANPRSEAAESVVVARKVLSAIGAL
jgi:uncharacterized protein (UPF0332 family)